MTLKTDIDQIAVDAGLLHDIVHGGSTAVVATDGGTVKSVAKAVSDAEAAIISGASSYLVQCQDEVGLAAAQAVLAQQQVAVAAGHVSSAALAADEAQAAWTAALAANPDLNPAVRQNPSTLTADLTIATGYNAYSAGPLTIGEGVSVTLNDNSNWSIL